MLKIQKENVVNENELNKTKLSLKNFSRSKDEKIKMEDLVDS